jgi:hypothetical protein
MTLFVDAYLIDGTGADPHTRAWLRVEGDPLADIAVLERRDRIHLVVLGGRTVVDRQP